MRKMALLFVVFVLALPASDAQAPPLDRMDVVLKSVPNGPVAKVRGVNISRNEFIRFYTGELTRISMRQERPLTMEARAELGLYCLRVLVQQELLYQDAQAKGIRVTDSEVAAQWKENKAELRKRAERLKGEPVSDQQLLEMAGYQSEADVLKEVRRSLLIEKMAQQVLKLGQADVDEAEIESFFESRREGFDRPDMLHLQQIFIRAEDGKSPRAIKNREDGKMKAEDVLKRVRAGESFDGLVRKYSDGSRREEGGHAGPLPLKAFPPFMVDAALQMKPGEVSDVLSSELGFHIIKLVGFTPGERADLQDAKGAIKRILQSREEEQILAEYCESLINDPEDLQVFVEIEKNLAYLTE